MDGQQSLELERGLICRVFFARGEAKMSKTFSLAKSCGVETAWFSDPSCRVVWKAGEKLFAGKNFAKANLSSLLKAIPAVAKQSEDEEEQAVTIDSEFFYDSERFVRDDDDLGEYVQLLREAHIENQTRELMSDTAEAMASGEMSATEAVSRMISRAQDIISLEGDRNRLSVETLAQQAVSQYETAYEEIVAKGNYEYTPGLKLPWRKLAYTLNGFGADLFVLAARPGIGKTSLAMNFARFWLDSGYYVVFNSVDMSPLGFVKRQIAEKTRISSRKMQFAKSDYFEKDIARVKEEAKRLSELEKSGKFTLFAEYDVDDLKAKCSILRDQGRIDVLIVDYLQLMTVKGGTRMGSTAKTTYISNTLHSLAVELGIPVLCLSQLNRDTSKEGGREPQLTDLRDSGAIEQDAAVVMLLSRDEDLYRKWQDVEPPVQFAKNRTPSLALKSYCPIVMNIAKCREGDAGTRIPFVVVQNLFAWYQADYEKRGQERFLRVYDDWRHADIEKIWAENGALIRMDDVRAAEIVSLNAQRTARGQTPIVLPRQQMPLVPVSPEPQSAPEPAATPSDDIDPYDEIPF